MNKELKKAENYLARFLSYRPRTVLEVEKKLKSKGISENIIKEVVEKAKNLGYLNDSKFTEEWIRYRKGKRMGNLKIKEELINMGIDREIIEGTLKENDELSSCIFFLKKKERDFKQNFNEKRKMFNFLRRRGFSVDVIKKAFKELNEEIIEEVV